MQVIAADRVGSHMSWGRHDGDSVTFPSKTGPGSQPSESSPTVNLHPQHRCDPILLREGQEDLLISQMQGQALCNPGEPYSQPRLPLLPGTNPHNLEIACFPALPGFWWSSPCLLLPKAWETQCTSEPYNG